MAEDGSGTGDLISGTKGWLGPIKTLVTLNDRLNSLSAAIAEHRTMITDLRVDLAKQSEQLRQLPLIVENIVLRHGKSDEST